MRGAGAVSSALQLRRKDESSFGFTFKISPAPPCSPLSPTPRTFREEGGSCGGGGAAEGTEVMGFTTGTALTHTPPAPT